MTKIERIECDCCGKHVNQALMSWENRASHFQATCPIDGINGGQWSMDVCRPCREKLHDAIRSTVDGLRENTAETIEQLRKEIAMYQQACDSHIDARNRMGEVIEDLEQQLADEKAYRKDCIATHGTLPEDANV